jgi:hypothetical protein
MAREPRAIFDFGFGTGPIYRIVNRKSLGSSLACRSVTCHLNWTPLHPSGNVRSSGR